MLIIPRTLGHMQIENVLPFSEVFLNRIVYSLLKLDCHQCFEDDNSHRKTSQFAFEFQVEAPN